MHGAGMFGDGGALVSNNFWVVIQTWMLAEQQRVYGLWMRRSRASPDYDAERYYPVHTSRYRMDAERLVG